MSREQLPNILLFSIAIVEDEINYSSNLAEHLTVKGCSIVSIQHEVDKILEEVVEKNLLPKILLLDNNLSSGPWLIFHHEPLSMDRNCITV